MTTAFPSDCLGSTKAAEIGSISLHLVHVNKNWFTQIIHHIIRLFAGIFCCSNRYVMIRDTDTHAIFRTTRSKILSFLWALQKTTYETILLVGGLKSNPSKIAKMRKEMDDEFVIKTGFTNFNTVEEVFG